MTSKTAPITTTLSALPSIGTAFEGGIFAGVTTKKDGIHCAVVLLPAKGKVLDRNAAKAWALEQGGELPTRPVAALLFANVQPELSPEWNWTADEYNASYAWFCNFDDGNVISIRKSYEGSAVAVRLIPLTA